MLDPIVDFMLRGGLAAILVLAAIHKLRDRTTFMGQLAAYDLLPETLIHGASRAIPLIELAAALFLLMRSAHASLTAAAIFFIYGAAMTINLARGRRDIDCGCGDPDGKQALHPALVVRNLVLVVCSLLVSWPVAARPLGWLDYVVSVLAVVAVLAIYTAFNTL
ncbi:MAG: MauE/DoxX family redox-associated membrane protein, partial [Parvibaculum sp.]